MLRQLVDVGVLGELGRQSVDLLENHGRMRWLDGQACASDLSAGGDAYVEKRHDVAIVPGLLTVPLRYEAGTLGVGLWRLVSKPFDASV